MIMATARGMEYDKIQCLDLGADDYLVKPFGMMEMVSRVRAVLRRCQKARSDTVLYAGNVCLNTDQRTVTADGEEVRLTYKEFEVLKLLLEHPARSLRETAFSARSGVRILSGKRERWICISGCSDRSSAKAER